MHHAANLLIVSKRFGAFVDKVSQQPSSHKPDRRGTHWSHCATAMHAAFTSRASGTGQHMASP
eukprot:365123-Chlamydomonas_euryale.AAC.39